MKWTDYFDRIVVFNLRKRQDRLIDITEQMELYDIPFELVTSIEHENGAEGLRLTTEKLFEDCVKKNVKRVLIFEDDCEFVVSKEVLDDTMINAIKQLPDYWLQLYMSGQVTCGFERRAGSHLLALHGVFATHSYALSYQGMLELLNYGLKAPIDNMMVDTIQKQGGTFITQPILTTQKAGISNIGGCEIDWSPFIIDRYNQKIIESGI